MEPRSFSLVDASIQDLLKALETRVINSVELVILYLHRIGKFDYRGPRLNSICVLNPNALEEAQASDDYRASGKARPLEGIPFTVKDSFKVKGLTVAACLWHSSISKPPMTQLSSRCYAKPALSSLGKPICLPWQTEDGGEDCMDGLRVRTTLSAVQQPMLQALRMDVELQRQRASLHSGSLARLSHLVGLRPRSALLSAIRLPVASFLLGDSGLCTRLAMS
jgi:hypothetical protein